jgi:hypothetical protein
MGIRHHRNTSQTDHDKTRDQDFFEHSHLSRTSNSEFPSHLRIRSPDFVSILTDNAPHVLAGENASASIFSQSAAT